MIRGGGIVLQTADLERAVRFYVETLGMKLVREEAGFATIDAGEGFLVELREGSASTSACLEFHPKVPLDEAVAIYENRGIAFTIDRTGTETVAHFVDPDGHALRLRGC